MQAITHGYPYLLDKFLEKGVVCGIGKKITEQPYVVELAVDVACECLVQRGHG